VLHIYAHSLQRRRDFTGALQPLEGGGGHIAQHLIPAAATKPFHDDEGVGSNAAAAEYGHAMWVADLENGREEG
jgi:hypothetical protein